METIRNLKEIQDTEEEKIYRKRRKESKEKERTIYGSEREVRPMRGCTRHNSFWPAHTHTFSLTNIYFLSYTHIQ